MRILFNLLVAIVSIPLIQLCDLLSNGPLSQHCITCICKHEFLALRPERSSMLSLFYDMCISVNRFSFHVNYILCQINNYQLGEIGGGERKAVLIPTFVRHFSQIIWSSREYSKTHTELLMQKNSVCKILLLCHSQNGCLCFLCDI